MRDLIEHLRLLPVERGGLRSGEGVVVGLSGGADSIALTSLLVELAPVLKLRVVAAHLDHGLRQDSASDRLFCAELCRSWDIPFASARARVSERSERTGEGIEAAGRKLRYAWFERVRRHHRFHRIATAHHLDDHLETILLWMGRGTGLAGLRGIAPRRGRLVRPLRDLRREQLHEYLRGRGIEWREDPSNRDLERTRNRLRSEVLGPLLEAFEPGAAQRIGAMSHRAEQSLEALEALANEKLESLLLRQADGVRELDRAEMAQLPQVVQLQVLRSLIGSFGGTESRQRWNEAHYSDVLLFTQGAHSGQSWTLPGGGLLEVARNRLVFTSPPAVGTPEEPAPSRSQIEDLELVQEFLTAPLQVTSFEGSEFAYLDADRVRLPLSLRRVRPGDRLRPFGMRGSKKVSTLLSEHSVPRSRRHQHLLVEDAQRIVWVVGVTTSEETRIHDGTQRVLKLALRSTDDVSQVESAS